MNKNIVENLIVKLKKKGADHCDVMLIKSNSISCSQRLGKLEKNEHSMEYDIGMEYGYSICLKALQKGRSESSVPEGISIFIIKYLSIYMEFLIYIYIEGNSCHPPP